MSKDVAAVMGIIPEDEYMIGCECAGVVRQIGPGVTKLRVGDRVVAQGQGTYVNRFKSIAECVHVIPSWMSFEEAASIPLVYSTAIQSLFHLADLQEGQVSETQTTLQTLRRDADKSYSRFSSTLLPVVLELLLFNWPSIRKRRSSSPLERTRSATS